MNNEQFRKLLFDNGSKSPASPDGTSPPKRSIPAPGLGARQRPSIPMTPRSVGLNNHTEFARQLAERNRAAKPQKKLKSSAPRGVKLAPGYVDRAKTREEEEQDDREARIKALEEALEKKEIDQATFEKIRSQIVGGDLSSTHLVKGLDFKLLERVRRGEDVYSDKNPESEEPGDEGAVDIDDEFDQVLEKDVTTVAKEKREKRGQISTVSLAPGKKRTRDQILAELKASREAAKAKQGESLGARFKKVGVKQMPGSRIERDSKGREVLIIVDEDGHEKRKVRKIQSSEEEEKKELMMPDKDAKPLGMEVPEIYRKQEEPEEDDGDINIFDEAGSDYDPLAGMGSGSDSESDSKGEDSKESKAKESKEQAAARNMPPPPIPEGPRNYFKDSKTGLVSQEERKAPSISDPEIQAALKKAAALNPIGRDEDDEGDGEEERARRERRKRMLQSVDRDAEDMDMGFGTSRFEDEEDFDDKRVKLSKWGGREGEADDGESRDGKSKRKRRPKTRKGDVNNAADVLRVMEQRKAAESKSTT